MPNYDFLNLSPIEFEDLSRDLLQKHLNITLESFTTGRDGGIDFRYSFVDGDDLIVQCKRYKDFDSLWTNLKKEQIKVKERKPNRYILTTSVGLTPYQKDEILQLFTPYIHDTADIVGKDDLNNWLGKYPEIEKQHFKLWLSSINILDRILHSKVYNQSEFEVEEIKETLKVYVQNNSYSQALDIIKKHRYIIISGIPGIGKTTLARILSYHYLVNGFDDFVFISESINDAYEVYQEHKKQIFFFDDFLGTNFLEKKLSTNEEQRLLGFIQKVEKSDNKILIMTTREYILEQAKVKYQKLNDYPFDITKCTINLYQYTQLERAKILYNHLFFSDIPQSYLKNIDKKIYVSIIGHFNYHPYIIERIIKNRVWENIEPSEFFDTVISYFDNPEKIWRHAYENQISKLSQYILINLLTAGTPILIDDLRILIQNFVKSHGAKYGIICNELEFKQAIRELENTFMKITKDMDNKEAVWYQDSSVKDFLRTHLQESPDLQKDIISAAIFLNQLFEVFTIIDASGLPLSLIYTNKILLENELKELWIAKLIKDYDDMKSSEITSILYYSLEFSWNKYPENRPYKKLNTIIENLILIEYYPTIQQAVGKWFLRNMNITPVSIDDFSYFLNVLEQLKDEIDIDKSNTIESLSQEINTLDNADQFHRFHEIFPEEYQNFIKTHPEFIQKISELIQNKADNIDINKSWDEPLYYIESVSEKFNINSKKIISTLERQIRKRAKKEKAEREKYDWNHEDEQEDYPHNYISEWKIMDMFQTLETKE